VLTHDALVRPLRVAATARRTQAGIYAHLLQLVDMIEHGSAYVLSIYAWNHDAR
jgi:hypothetical protein